MAVKPDRRALHHRVGNELQGIAGLLGLRAAREPRAAPALRAAIRQVQAMALVHRLESAHDGNLRLGPLVSAMLEALRRTEDVDVRFDNALRRADWALPGPQAVPIALITNELLWNAVQHRDRGAADGVRVSLARADDATAVLSVRNRGSLREGAAAGEGGLGLMRSLLAPEAGALELSSEDGWVEARLRLQSAALRAPARSASRRARKSSTRRGLVR